MRQFELNAISVEYSTDPVEYLTDPVEYTTEVCNWCPFYEAQFGVEIYVELYTLHFCHQSPPTCCKDTLPSTS